MLAWSLTDNSHSFSEVKWVVLRTILLLRLRRCSWPFFNFVEECTQAVLRSSRSLGYHLLWHRHATSCCIRHHTHWRRHLFRHGPRCTTWLLHHHVHLHHHLLHLVLHLLHHLWLSLLGSRLQVHLLHALLHHLHLLLHHLHLLRIATLSCNVRWVDTHHAWLRLLGSALLN